MLKVIDLKKEFSSDSGKVIAVDGVSFTVPTGQFASIIGKSGSGKSTLLSLLGALDKPTSGSIDVESQDITKLNARALNQYRCRKIGFVFQSYQLVPNLTALENVMLPMEFAKVGKAERRERA